MPQFAAEYWPETLSRVEFFPATQPPNLPVSAVKIYVFQGDNLLLTKITGRGWDLPGGHIEAGETPEEAIVRELQEETGASIKNFVFIGYLKITNQQENERNKKYPKESCILVYKSYEAEVDANHKFQFEASESRFVALQELPSVHHDWNEAKAQVLAYALTCR